MEYSFLTDYAVPIIVGICWCIGCIIKNIIPAKKINKFIPLIMGVLGVALNTWINMEFTPTILMGGLASGLTSTGINELVKNLKEYLDSQKNKPTTTY